MLVSDERSKKAQFIFRRVDDLCCQDVECRDGLSFVAAVGFQ